MPNERKEKAQSRCDKKANESSQPKITQAISLIILVNLVCSVFMPFAYAFERAEQS